MRDTPTEPPDRRPDASAASQRPENTPEDVGDRVRGRVPDDDNPRQAAPDRGRDSARTAPELADREVLSRWGQALALDEPGGRNTALADLARRDDVDPDLGRRVANGIVGDDDVRTGVLRELADKASDPDLARRIANDIPQIGERNVTLARLADRTGPVDADLGRRIAGDIGDVELRADVLGQLANSAGDPGLARRIANDIPVGSRRDTALARLADRTGPVDADLGRRIAGDIGDVELRADVLGELADRTGDAGLARRIANDIPVGSRRDSALARVGRRPDIDIDLGHRVANDITGDPHLRTDVLGDLADRTTDPQLARRIANDIPLDAERSGAIARLAQRFPDDIDGID